MSEEARRTLWSYDGLNEQYQSGWDALEAADLSSGNLLSSLTVEGEHAPLIDIDNIPVYVFPSSTEGHYHLYIDKAIPWSKYEKLLDALRGCGIIEEGYLIAAKERRATFARPPWIKKVPPIPQDGKPRFGRRRLMGRWHRYGCQDCGFEQMRLWDATSPQIHQGCFGKGLMYLLDYIASDVWKSKLNDTLFSIDSPDESV